MAHSPAGEISRQSPSRQPPRQIGQLGSKHDHPFMPASVAMDREPRVSPLSAQLSKDSGAAEGARSTGQDLTRSPEFHDLELPDYIESSMQDFDIDELLQADITPPEMEGDAYALESTFASSTSPEDESGSNEGTYNMIRGNTLSGEQTSLCHT